MKLAGLTLLRTFKNNYISKDPVGYELQDGTTKRLYYVLRGDLINMMKEQGDLDNAKLVEKETPKGVIYIIQGKRKGDSLIAKGRVKSLDALQRKTLAGEIDYSNKLQKYFTAI